MEITEIPIKKWTRDYKNFLEDLALKNEILDIKEYHKENKVHFVVKMEGLGRLSDEEIEKKFKLSTSLSCNNFVLFDENY